MLKSFASSSIQGTATLLLMGLPQKTPSHLLGIGLDNEDGHKRLTTAKEFSIIGGSQETHEKMAEAVLRAIKVLSRKGKHLGDAQPEELRRLITYNL